MLRFNPKRVFALRGIENPVTVMLEAGIIRNTVNNLLRQQTSVVKIEHVEILCRLLNCTPNDLYEWHPTGADALPETHSLNALKRKKTVQDINALVKEIPLEKVEELIGGQS